jgi:histidinol-phosphate aminotransferase
MPVDPSQQGPPTDRRRIAGGLAARGAGRTVTRMGDELVGPRLRAVLAGIPRYVPGRPAGAGPGGVVHKLSSNENPYPPLPSVVEAVTRAAARMNRYPDMANVSLVGAVAERLGVPAECVVAGTGSVAVLGHLVQAVCDEGDEVVYAWRSFEAYPIATQVGGATHVPVPLGFEARHDLPAMATAVTARTRLVLICSPNNPTGPAVHTEELEAFLDRVPRDVLVVLDEAYVEFVRDEKAPDGVELWRRHPNLAVLRTFSKAYGLAGLRVGYVVAHPAVADAVRATALPFGVSTLAQEAAVASLAAEAELLERVDAIVAERERVVAALRRQGWPVPDAQGNFVWFDLADRSVEFATACQQGGVVVRPFAGDGVRCTIDVPEANDRLLAVAAAFPH